MNPFQKLEDERVNVLFCDIISCLSPHIWPRGYKTFPMLNTTEYGVFSSKKYENASNGWQIHILFAEIFLCSAMFSKKEFAVYSNYEIYQQDLFHAQLR